MAIIQYFTLEQWRTLFSAATFASVVVAILNYWFALRKARKDKIYNQDKLICDQAINTLERSYKVLCENCRDDSAPKPNRLNWLTAARLLLRYKELRNSLRTNTFKTVCHSNEEYWTYQFYLKLHNNELLDPDYFKGSDFLNSIENIEIKSALTIFHFSKWGMKQKDPLTEVNEKEIINDEYTLRGEIGLREYINSLKEEGKIS